MSHSIMPTIHARGEAKRLDHVLDIVSFAARPCPLSTSLDELPRRIATVFGADICSIYLLEGDDLVMRGNVGFPADALGEVRLAVGEGITGLAVECMRPMSIGAAPQHESYRYFPGLGEEHFPIFLVVPVAGPSGPLGALVLQRRQAPAFDQSDVELSAALTVPIAAAAERAKLVDALKGQRRTAGDSTRRVTLAGRPSVPGRAVGAVYTLRRPAARPNAEPARTRAETVRVFDAALSEAERTLDALEARARDLQLETGFFSGARTILQDGRMRERVLERTAAGDGLGKALAYIGGEAARAATHVGDTFRLERAREIADVCEALAMLCASDRSAEVPRGAALAADHLTMFDALVSGRTGTGAAAIVLAEGARGPVTRTLLALLGVPAVVEVTGLFRWVTDGDIVLVDADHGLVRLNPSRAEVALVRAEKRHRAKEE